MEASSWSVIEPTAFDFPSVSEIRLALVKGRFDVITSNSPEVRLEISEVSGQPLEVSLSGGTLKVEHFSTGNWLNRLVNFQSNDTAVISIAVPAGTIVKAATVQGDGMVSGSIHTTLRTVSGSLLCDATQGKLTTNSVNGEVIIRNHRGSLNAKSVSGDITAQGEIDVVLANSVSGNIACELHGAPKEFSAKTVSGNITVRVPQSVGTEVNANSVSGHLIVGQQRFSGSGQSIHTALGPLPSSLSAKTNTVSGTVSILQSDEATHVSLNKDAG